jgi:hypothetical protein
VFTSTNRNSPQYEALDFISQGRTLVIFITAAFSKEMVAAPQPAEPA